MAGAWTVSPDAARDALALLGAVADEDEEAIRVLLGTMGDPAETAVLLARMLAGYVPESGHDIRPALRLARSEIPDD